MVKGLHLPPRHRKEIVALLHKHLPGVEVWAYGSRVNGQSHDGSATWIWCCAARNLPKSTLRSSLISSKRCRILLSPSWWKRATGRACLRAFIARSTASMWC